MLRPLSTTTTLMFDVGYGILGALTGFGIAIGLFGGGWSILLRALIYSVIIAVGYLAVRKWLSRDEFTVDRRTRGRRPVSSRWLRPSCCFGAEIGSPFLQGQNAKKRRICGLL
jgi:hypothetical protein